MSDLVLRVTELIGVIVAERVAVEVSVLKQERDDWRKRAEAAEAKLLEVRGIVAAPQCVPLKPEEVDGFRVGDLVRWSGLMGDACAMSGGARWRPISSFDGLKASYEGGVRNGYPTSKLTRKPVEVGDTVRIVEGGHAGRIGRVDGIVCGEARVVTDPNASLGEALWVMLPRLVAVAP